MIHVLNHLNKMQNKKSNRLEFHISYKCNNRCIFCSEQEFLNQFKNYFINTGIVSKVLKKYQLKSYEHVTLTGGEPSMHPDIFRILETAKALNYRIYIGTNGIKLSDYNFCQKVMPYIDELSFSVHGHNAEIHNLHTQNKNSFENIKKTLENVKKINKKADYFVNIVITKQNIDYLEDIIDFVAKYKLIGQIMFSNLAPEGSGLDNYSELGVKFDKLANKIPSLIKLCEKVDIKPRFFGVPICLLPLEEYSNDFNWCPRTTVEIREKNANKYLKETISGDPNRERIKPEKCNQCLVSYCGGIFEEYYKLYGDKEIKPLKNNEL